jgi:hypothetical protein
MGCVREKDTLRLAGINQPRDFFARLHVLLDKLGFFRTFSYCFLVALGAVCQLGDPREAPVLAKVMTTFTLAQFFHMYLVVEVNGLFFFGIKEQREDHPADKEVGHKADEKCS